MLTQSSSYHTVVMWQDRGLLKCRSRYIGWNLTDAQPLLSGGSRTRTASICHEAWIYMYFPIFAPAVRPGTQSCKPYIQQYLMLGYKSEHKLLDIRLRLDMMTVDEVRWAPYRLQEIQDCWVSTWHGFIAYFDCVEAYMSARDVRSKELICGGNVARGTIVFIDRDLD
ncbi:hypothetical protein M9H77_17005 [Catharanthus roseus]|uniref:Uncharacterized protein n=1 Tax=Catharanthus roseus TaxID=4058 RepID=A0ACC0B3C9_CATRO|nr:hypothetical protein M9H77_17005 [Catharanthus roseus]